MWEEFKQKTGKCIYLSAFRKLRPNHCLTMDHQTFAYCLCEVCINVELKIKVLKDAARLRSLTTIDKFSKYSVTNATLCTPHTLKCNSRECAKCGVGNLEEKLKEQFSACLTEATKWQKWETGQVSVDGKKRKVLVDVHGTIDKCIGELCEELVSLAMQLFNAKWQRDHINKLKATPPKDWVISVADLAENYRCTHQDEISAAYYDYTQVTLHPMTSFYACNIYGDTVQESMVFISPDLLHDAHCVEQFTNHI